MKIFIRSTNGYDVQGECPLGDLPDTEETRAALAQVAAAIYALEYKHDAGYYQIIQREDGKILECRSGLVNDTNQYLWEEEEK